MLKLQNVGILGLMQDINDVSLQQELRTAVILCIDTLKHMAQSVAEESSPSPDSAMAAWSSGMILA